MLPSPQLRQLLIQHLQHPFTHLQVYNTMQSFTWNTSGVSLLSTSPTPPPHPPAQVSLIQKDWILACCCSWSKSSSPSPHWMIVTLLLCVNIPRLVPSPWHSLHRCLQSSAGEDVEISWSHTVPFMPLCTEQEGWKMIWIAILKFDVKSNGTRLCAYES